jgi:hypothetical protein
MNLNDFLYDMINGRRRTKPQMIMLAVVLLFAVFVFFFIFIQRETDSERKVKPYVMHKTPPPQNLDYQIVKVDTIPFSHPALPPASYSTSPSAPPKTIATAERSASTRSREYVAPPPASQPTRFNASGGRGDGGDMIIVSTLGQPQGAGSSGNFGGSQSLHVKVILQDRTAVTNGSLLEARVMQDETWGNVEIPRRSSLLGVCNLQNNRVQIDFREIRIKGETYTCSGRAYDLKSLPGLSYVPLTAEAQKAVVDELKSAAAGVPVVGRYLNQSNYNPLTEEITTLDEGLEFYAWITNIIYRR